ncbi:MAG: site-2 protease family protein, partial [Acidobacteriota bacterium]|nr:site-2 protease family protein [Acidobacteriota bacterium]
PEAHPGYSKTQYWLMGVLASALVFASILAHELAHSLVSVKKGIKVTSVRLFIFGGLSENASEPKDGREEFLIALAGPAASMFLGIAFFMIFVAMQMTPLPGLASGVALWVAMANFCLAVFNLAPGFPLDGGRILRAFLWDRWNDLPRATRTVGRIGNSFALFLIVFGILQMIAQSYLSGLWFVFIGFFIKQASRGGGEVVSMKNVVAGTPVRQVMKEDVVAVDWLLSVHEFVEEYIHKYQFADFPVLNQGEFVGMVSMEDAKPVEERLRRFKQVRDIMIPVEQTACLAPEDDASGALDRMVAAGVERMPVTAGERLLGVVSRQDILNYFKVAR